MGHSLFLNWTCDIRKYKRQGQVALQFLKIDMRHWGSPIKAPSLTHGVVCVALPAYAFYPLDLPGTYTHRRPWIYRLLDCLLHTLASLLPSHPWGPGFNVSMNHDDMDFFVCIQNLSACNWSVKYTWPPTVLMSYGPQWRIKSQNPGVGGANPYSKKKNIHRNTPKKHRNTIFPGISQFQEGKNKWSLRRRAPPPLFFLNP